MERDHECDVEQAFYDLGIEGRDISAFIKRGLGVCDQVLMARTVANVDR
jgi:hypothetical protein